MVRVIKAISFLVAFGTLFVALARGSLSSTILAIVIPLVLLFLLLHYCQIDPATMRITLKRRSRERP